MPVKEKEEQGGGLEPVVEGEDHLPANIKVVLNFATSCKSIMTVP